MDTGDGHSDWEFEDLYDEETLAALEAWEPAGTGPHEPGEELPSRLTRWGRESAVGLMLSGFALGIQEVLEPREQRRIVIEVDDDGEPHHLPVELFLDPDSPEGSLCVVHRDVPPSPTL